MTPDYIESYKPRRKEPWYSRHALKLLVAFVILLGFLTYFQFTSPLLHAKAAEKVDSHQYVKEFEAETRAWCVKNVDEHCKGWLAKHPL